MAEWRAGKSTGRTLWRDEQLVGMVDSDEVASEIVAALNASEDRRAAMWPPACPSCLRHVMPDGGGRYMPHRDGVSEDWCGGSRTKVHDEVLAAWRAAIAPESGRERSPEPAACGCPITLETTRVTRHSRECSVRQAAERIEAGTEDERPAECCCAGCIGMGPCDDDLGKSDDDASDDLGPPAGECCDGGTGTPGVDCDCAWLIP